MVVGEAKPPKKSCPLEDIEVVRDWGFCADIVGEVKLLKRSPLAEPAGEVTFGAAGVDFALAKLVKLANGEGFSAGMADGGEVVDGKLSPLKASVRPPMFDVDGATDEAMSPKELVRSCWTGARAGCGLEYKDRIDCFKSGRDMPFGAAGVDAVLLGRLPADG